MKTKTASPSNTEEGYQSFSEVLIEFLASRESVRVVLAHAEFQTRLKLICGGITREPEKAAELVQNTCVRLLKYEKTILQKNPSNADQFFSLVFKVAQNIHFDSGKKNRLLFEERPLEDVSLRDNGLDPEHESLFNEFERFVQTLPTAHQRAFELKWEGHSYRDVAEILRIEGHVCTHVTVRTWISNGRRDFIKGAWAKKASGF
jgi:DNA-directed RNA polymerase specialized sigma24 family protein